MADYIITDKKQSKAEIRQWDFDFSGDLPSGVTVTSAVATHVAPSGDASTTTVGTIASGVVPVKLGPLSVTGAHFLSVLATYSNSEKSEIKLRITVEF